MKQPSPQVSHFETAHVSLKSYTYGFVTCIVLTLLAYCIALYDGVSDQLAIAIIGGLALVQCAVQLRRFLHLGVESRPRWKLAAFAIMLAVLAIIVIGSLWIMDNLSYRMIHSPQEMEQYVESQDGL